MGLTRTYLSYKINGLRSRHILGVRVGVGMVQGKSTIVPADKEIARHWLRSRGPVAGERRNLKIRVAVYAWLMDHSSSPPSERIAVRIFRTASSSRVLIVPKGMPVLAAISRWLNPR